MSLVYVAEKDGNFKILLELVELAGFTSKLRESDITVFAPTDEVFKSMGEGFLKKIKLEKNRENLKRILKYHILPLRLLSSDIVGTATPYTLEGKNLCVFLAGEEGRKKVHVNDAVVVRADVLALNGVAHVIDKILNPIESCQSCLGSCSFSSNSGYQRLSPPPKAASPKRSPSTSR